MGCQKDKCLCIEYKIKFAKEFAYEKKEEISQTSVWNVHMSKVLLALLICLFWIDHQE